MADESCRCAVVLICGIPASGKSTIATKLLQHVLKIKGDAMHMIHVCYDDLIPSDLDVYGSNVAHQHQNDPQWKPDKNSDEKGDTLSMDTSISPEKYSLWKQFRRRILEAVEKVMHMIENNQKHEVDRSSFDEEYEQKMEGLPTAQKFWNIFLRSISKKERKCSCIASSDWR